MDRAALDVGRLRTLLGARWGWVRVVDTTASTNADLLAAAADGAPDRSLLVAEYQDAGRGRFDRVWSSPRGAGLTFSVLLRPSVPPAAWGWLPLLAGVALADAVRDSVPLAPMLKWPNDVLAWDDRKLAGVLVQAAAGAVVIGIGLNVSTTAGELPVDTATSLALAGVREVDRTEVLAAIAGSLDTWVTRWSDADGDAAGCGLAGAYWSMCATLGHDVRVALADGAAVVGTARDVDASGALLVDTAAGTRTIAAGDVEHLRPT